MYWHSSGESHTTTTVELARQTAEARGIAHVLVASNSGNTALLLAATVPHLVCVTHVIGFFAPGESDKG